MQTIGEKLEEARKRKGISLREASEATKIRSDFLSSIEQNQFGFELPEIYKRGFLKNYANYLKLDTQSILNDYTTQILNPSQGSRKNSSELFGSIDLMPTQASTNEPILGKFSTTSQVEEASEETSHVSGIDKTLYLKLALVIIGALTFIAIVIGLITSVLSSGDEPEIETATSDVPTATSGTNESSGTGMPSANNVSGLPSSGEENMSLIANGTVYVLVKQRNDNKELVRTTLSAGETLNFVKQGPIDILFTAGEHLVIVNTSGERLRPKGEGTAKISIP